MRRAFASLLRHARLAPVSKRERAMVIVPKGGVVDAYLLAKDADGHRVSVEESLRAVPAIQMRGS